MNVPPQMSCPSVHDGNLGGLEQGSGVCSLAWSPHSSEPGLPSPETAVTTTSNRAIHVPKSVVNVSKPGQQPQKDHINSGGHCGFCKKDVKSINSHMPDDEGKQTANWNYILNELSGTMNAVTQVSGGKTGVLVSGLSE